MAWNLSWSGARRRSPLPNGGSLSTLHCSPARKPVVDTYTFTSISLRRFSANQPGWTTTISSVRSSENIVYDRTTGRTGCYAPDEIRRAWMRMRINSSTMMTYIAYECKSENITGLNSNILGLYGAIHRIIKEWNFNVFQSEEWHIYSGDQRRSGRRRRRIWGGVFQQPCPPDSSTAADPEVLAEFETPHQISDEDEAPDSYRQTTCEITARKVFGEFVINAHLEYYYKMTHD